MESGKTKKRKKVKKTFPLLIFSFVLVYLLSSFSAAVFVTEAPITAEEAENILEIDPDAVIADGEGIAVQIEQTLSAGSWIPVTAYAGHQLFTGKIVMSFLALTFLNDFTDAEGRWVFESPGGRIYEENVDIDIYNILSLYLVVADDPHWHVPFNPQQGGWRLKFYVWDTALFFIERNIELLVFHFTVGESSVVGQITAPFYWYFGGMTFGWGAFGLVIPCFLLIALTPVWILLMLIIIKVWVGWAKLGAREIRKIKPKKNKIEKKNGGKGNEKADIGYYK